MGHLFLYDIFLLQEEDALLLQEDNVFLVQEVDLCKLLTPARTMQIPKRNLKPDGIF